MGKLSPYSQQQPQYTYEYDFDGILESGAIKLTSPDHFYHGGTPLRNGQLRPGEAPKYSSSEVLGLFAQYVAVGILYGVLPNLAYPVFTNYFHMTGAQVNSATNLIQLGWNFKVFVGVLSDCVPLFGYRRKSWMMVGWFLCSVCMLVLAIAHHGEPYYVDLPVPISAATPEQLNNATTNSDAFKHGAFISLICGLASMCYIVSDVAADALLVEIAQREPEATRGRLQSLAYTARTVASVVSQTILGVGLNSKAYNGTFNWDIGLNALFWILTCPCLLMIPLSFMFIRESNHHSVNVYDYFGHCWRFLLNRAVVQVMLFIFLFNLFTCITTTAAPYVMTFWAKAENMNSQFASIASNLISAVGIAVTGQFGTTWNWRVTVITCLVVSTLMDAVIQFLTIWGVVRNQWFYLFSMSLKEFPSSISWMVLSFMNVELADIGNEGVTYALLTTISNLPQSLSSVVSNIICSQLNIGADEISADAQSTRWEVTYSYFIQHGSNLLACVVVLLMLPAQKYHIQHMKLSPVRHPYWALFVVLLIVAALVFSTTGSIMSMFDSTSCYVIAGGDGCT
ncbi:hypothetical protein AeMF1_000969 [Aphanomyces euteiches]|nr:hypothetical protein AeMF1_000969 [Aphanomyces euteiches]KAH9131502.1 hypothetical protein AeNC1_019603 [Aphanomyces euteiches]